jgi:hypothetical protein
LAELLTTDPEAWRMLGPVQPPNPALSWEYWNGTSWWALDAANMTDATSNLLAEGDISFTVPEDIGKSDVGGRENYWIRARLVGGDYGEAQVTVSSVTVAGVTRQTVERDVSTIRAPYVTSFDVRFRVDDAVQPRVVLTEDNLGMVDQTQANMVGLPIPVFTPLRDLMNSGAPPAAPVSRALMIGIDKPVWGDPVSLYVDVAPGRAGSELVAEVYRGERFEPVQVRDDSHGLSEPGLIQLSLPVSPDQAELFGRTACWLRFRPRGSPPDWSPRIRAVHSNAVYARSVETRELETLGRSAGTSDQRFALAGSPVESGSLDLRVAEAVGDEEADVLDAAATGAANPGPWARWDQIDDIDDAEGPARVFMLDADAGVVRFGDGRHGAIPPIGAELLALRYRCVAGAAANEVAAGAALLLSSPLTNIERVTALDDAAGGGDRESIEAARRRGAAKLRHGGRILTLADLEDHARDSSTRPAQVRAENLDRGVRLVVAARGADPRPAPAQLRAFERAIREAAGYGIARPGGVTVIAPRLLPLRVTLTLAPDDPGRFIELADAARSALVALFDPATGGLDRQGWRIGRAPAASDLAAALDPLAERGSVSIGALMRGDRSEPTIFPSTVPSDVLVRLDPSDIDCKRREDITA